MDLRKIMIFIMITLLCLTALPAFAQESEETEEIPAAVPEAPVPEYPVNAETTEIIGFYWTPSANAENYEVSWRNEQGTEGSVELADSSWSCQMGRCIAYEEVPGAGSYTWTVTASNEAGSAVSEESAFTVRMGIPTPDAYRPSSALNSRKALTFEWQAVGSAPTEYRIQVLDRNSGTICVDRTIPAAAIYVVNGECYIETDIYLPEGEYSWRVQGSNETERSGWSGWREFQLSCADCYLGNYMNTVTAVYSPNGRTLDPDLRYEWLAVTGASYYQLNMKDASGTDVLTESVLASVCGDFTCSYDPDLTLTPGEVYTWSLSTCGATGARWGTAEGTVGLIETADAPAVAFTGPADNGTLDPEYPQVVWTDPGIAAASFRLIVCDAEGNALLYTDLTREDAWCDGQTCSVVFMEIPEGTGYRIYVTPYSETNTPGPTAALTFNRE